MSTISLRSRRTVVPAVIGIVMTALVLALAVPAGAAGRFHASARMHAAKTVVSTVRVRVVATATATAGSPASRARVTVRVWATATGRARAGAWARAHRSGNTPAAARDAARVAAHRKAVHRARGRALAVARTRALALARAIGQKRADAAARQAAVSQARALAATGSTTGSGCTALPKANGGTWQCTFDEEFDGTTLNPAKWQVATSAATGVSTGGACFVNSPDNVAVGGGVLSLTVRKLAAPMNCPAGAGKTISTPYTGGQVATYGKFSQTYGRFAVRAKFPPAVLAGLQSTLWLWPVKLPTGEIDIAEWYSLYPDRIIPYLHYAYTGTTVTSYDPLAGTNVVTNNYFLVNDVAAFHEYAVEWTSATLKITVDDRTVLIDRIAAYGPSPFDQPFFVALTAALGSGADAVDAKTPLPATTQVDWVRAWK